MPVPRLVLTRPDDWHLHLRDGPMLDAVIAPTARVFGRAIVMPNLRPPVTTTAAAAGYRERILAALPSGTSFVPLMTLYLTDNTTADEIARARESGFVHAVKYYPAGATTHSDAGVTALSRVYPALAAMERVGASNPKLAAMGTTFLDQGWTEADQIANAVAFLVSDEARFITAEHLSVDGGVQHF